MLLRVPGRSASASQILSHSGRARVTAAQAGGRQAAPTMIFVNASQVVTCAGPPRGRRGKEMADAGVRTDAAVAVVGDRIAAVAPLSELEPRYPAAQLIDCGGGVLTPGL